MATSTIFLQPDQLGALGAATLERYQQERHLPAFHFGRLIDRRHILDLGGQGVENLPGSVLIRHLATPETHTHLDPVPLPDKLADVSKAISQVVIRDIGGFDAYRFELNVVLFFARLFGPFLLIIAVFAVVHQAADRGTGIGGDFDEVDLLGLGHFHRGWGVDNSDLLAIAVNQANLRDSYGIVDSCCRLRLGDNRSSLEPKT